jgi:hypothetical protein
MPIPTSEFNPGHRFVFTHPQQRDYWIGFTNAVVVAVGRIRAELGHQTPSADVVDKAIQDVTNNMNALQHAVVMQLATKPVDTADARRGDSSWLK